MPVMQLLPEIPGSLALLKNKVAERGKKKIKA